jgi:hAT family C-terminal dimerisation region
MAQYYNSRPSAIPIQRGTVPGTQDANDDEASEFDKHRETLLTADTEEGWAAELGRYTGTMQRDVTKNTDLVEWWQDNAPLYPTLARIALDVLPSQASSVPCERVFSVSKQIAIDRQACLSFTVFEQLVIMGSAWRPDLYDMAAWTAFQQEEVEPAEFLEFEEMLDDDVTSLTWEKELDMEIVV